MAEKVRLTDDAQSEAFLHWVEAAQAYTAAEELQEAVEGERWWASLSAQERAEIDDEFRKRFGKTYREQMLSGDAERARAEDE